MFWKDIKYHLKSPTLQDVARFSYTVNESMIPENLHNEEHKVRVESRRQRIKTCHFCI